MEMIKPDSFPSSPSSVIRLDSTSVSAGSVLPTSGPMAANISYSGSSTFSPRYGPSVMVTMWQWWDPQAQHGLGVASSAPGRTGRS